MRKLRGAWCESQFFRLADATRLEVGASLYRLLQGHFEARADLWLFGVV